MSNEKRDNENTSLLLSRLYRLAYESINHEETTQNLPDKFKHIIQHITNFPVNLNEIIPQSTQELIQILKKIVSSLNNEEIPQQKYNVSFDNAKLQLVGYCKTGKIDDAILLILNYKLLNATKSATDICNYVHNTGKGWDSYNDAAIHHLIASNYEYDNDDDDDDEDNDDNEDDAKHLLLFEIFFKEKTSTKLKRSQSGWQIRSEEQTVMDMILAKNNINISNLLFKYGYDIDINVSCSSSWRSRRCNGGRTWKPIHTAITRNNYELTKLIIERGADINAYKTRRFSSEDGDSSRRKLTALYCICSADDKEDDNTMLKLLLNTHQQKFNGVPDVNALSVIQTSESQYALGILQRPQKNSPNDDDDDEDDYYEDDYEPHLSLFTYRTCMHAAIKRCNIEMIKLLLIYGADLNIAEIKTSQIHDGDKEKLLEIQKNGKNAMKDWEYIKNVFDLLKEADGDEKVKIFIDKMFKSGSRWFPELIDFYPNNMELCIKSILEALQMESFDIPIEIINIVIDYFYDIVEKDSN